MTARTADLIYQPTDVLTPAGTTSVAPLSTPLVIPHAQLLAVELLIPPGHAGVTGFRLELAGEPLLPWGRPAGWFRGENLHATYDTDIEVDRGLVAVTFNVGFYDHTHYVRLKLRTTFGVPALPSARIVDLNAGAGARGS